MSALLTVKMLTDVKACSEQVDLFRETFGSRVNVTVARACKVAEQFDWVFAYRFLDLEGCAEYERVIYAARAEYQRVHSASWGEYERAIHAARAEYLSISAEALAERERISNAALAERERAIHAARAEYLSISAGAWASAYIATCKRRKAARPQHVASPLIREKLI